MRGNEQEQILNYEVTGRGPVIVLLHGYLCSLHYWDNLRPHLEQHYTVVVIDLLGFGESPKPRRSWYTYREHLDWIQRTLDHAGFADQPFTLAGHSMGALLSLRYASLYPKSVHKLLLLNIPLFKDANEARRELASTNIFFRLSLYWQLHRLICPLMRTAVMRLLMRQVMPLQYKGMETYLFAANVEARNRSLWNVIEAQQSLSELKHLPVTTTVLVGAKERPAYLENLHSVEVTDRLTILTPETGHHMPIENPQLALDLLSE